MLWPAGARSEEHPIDVANSALTIRVYKAGLFSLFAHNHEIEAPISRGKVELSDSPGVQLEVDARRLRVVDPEVSEADRTEIQQTMEGAKVLDSGRFPQILFHSTRVEEKGAERWLVHGDLTLHGETRPVAVEVKRVGGRYQGSARLKQRDFGITPVTIAAGTVRVKDEVKIEFTIALLR